MGYTVDCNCSFINKVYIYLAKMFCWFPFPFIQHPECLFVIILVVFCSVNVQGDDALYVSTFLCCSDELYFLCPECIFLYGV